MCSRTTCATSAACAARPSPGPGCSRATCARTPARSPSAARTAARPSPTAPTCARTCRRTRPSSITAAASATRASLSSPTSTSTARPHASRLPSRRPPPARPAEPPLRRVPAEASPTPQSSVSPACTLGGVRVNPILTQDFLFDPHQAHHLLPAPDPPLRPPTLSILPTTRTLTPSLAFKAPNSGTRSVPLRVPALEVSPAPTLGCAPY
ncbi:hypothetical protein LEMLEM_LOCUS502 [Lemmus lemmus]